MSVHVKQPQVSEKLTGVYAAAPVGEGEGMVVVAPGMGDESGRGGVIVIQGGDGSAVVWVFSAVKIRHYARPEQRC